MGNTVEGMAATFGVELSVEAKRLVSQNLVYLSKHGAEPIDSGRKRFIDSHGSYQSYVVSVFPESYLDAFERICMVLKVL